jgi:3-oxoadipate enol-lactonase
VQTPLRVSASPQAQFLERADTRVRFYDTGNGPPLLLLHGWALDARVWDPLVAELAQEFRVLRIDRRASVRSSAQPDLIADAEDAIALLDHLALARAIVIGMSQGARVALNLFALALERVAGIVLDGPPPDPRLVGGDWPDDVNPAALARLLTASGSAALRAAVAANPLMQLYAAEPPAKMLLVDLLGDYSGTDLAAAQSRAPVALNVAQLQALPVLLINGELDTPHRRSVIEAYARVLPHGGVRVLRGAGHLACLDAPREYAAVIREFSKLTTG